MKTDKKDKKKKLLILLGLGVVGVAIWLFLRRRKTSNVFLNINNYSFSNYAPLTEAQVKSELEKANALVDSKGVDGAILDLQSQIDTLKSQATPESLALANLLQDFISDLQTQKENQIRSASTGNITTSGGGIGSITTVSANPNDSKFAPLTASQIQSEVDATNGYLVSQGLANTIKWLNDRITKLSSSTNPSDIALSNLLQSFLTQLNAQTPSLVTITANSGEYAPLTPTEIKAEVDATNASLATNGIIATLNALNNRIDRLKPSTNPSDIAMVSLLQSFVSQLNGLSGQNTTTSTTPTTTNTTSGSTMSGSVNDLLAPTTTTTTTTTTPKVDTTLTIPTTTTTTTTTTTPKVDTTLTIPTTTTTSGSTMSGSVNDLLAPTNTTTSTTTTPTRVDTTPITTTPIRTIATCDYFNRGIRRGGSSSLLNSNEGNSIKITLSGATYGRYLPLGINNANGQDLITGKKYFIRIDYDVQVSSNWSGGYIALGSSIDSNAQTISLDGLQKSRIPIITEGTFTTSNIYMALGGTTNRSEVINGNIYITISEFLECVTSPLFTSPVPPLNPIIIAPSPTSTTPTTTGLACSYSSTYYLLPEPAYGFLNKGVTQSNQATLDASNAVSGSTISIRLDSTSLGFSSYINQDVEILVRITNATNPSPFPFVFQLGGQSPVTLPAGSTGDFRMTANWGATANDFIKLVLGNKTDVNNTLNSWSGNIIMKVGNSGCVTRLIQI